MLKHVSKFNPLYMVTSSSSWTRPTLISVFNLSCTQIKYLMRNSNKILLSKKYHIGLRKDDYPFFSAKSYQLLQVPSQHLKCLHDKIGYPHSTVTGQCSKKSRQFNLFTTTFYKRPFKLVHTNIIFAITAWCNNRETIWLSGNIGLRNYQLHIHGNSYEIVTETDRLYMVVTGNFVYCYIYYAVTHQKLLWLSLNDYHTSMEWL